MNVTVLKSIALPEINAHKQIYQKGDFETPQAVAQRPLGDFDNVLDSGEESKTLSQINEGKPQAVAQLDKAIEKNERSINQTVQTLKELRETNSEL